jgi:uncharacterized protein (DUF433 family)
VKHSTLAKTIERDPAKMSGEWVFRGTRVPLATLFENLKDGASVDEFLEWFPGVKREQVEAVLDHELASFAEMADA